MHMKHAVERGEESGYFIENEHERERVREHTDIL